MSRNLHFVAISLLWLAPIVLSQDSKRFAVVHGEIEAGASFAGSHLVVKLYDMSAHQVVDTAYLRGDGTFEFRGIPAGQYLISVAQPPAEPLLEEYVTVNPQSDVIRLRLPEQSSGSHTRAATVSAQQLRQPPSKKSAKVLARASQLSEEGQYLKAVDELRHALDDPFAAGYARANMGVAYLRAGQPAAAITEFELADRLNPDEPGTRINLAYALLKTEQWERAEAEARRAVQLDKSSANARWILGSILLHSESSAAEGAEDLKLASREIPRARVPLAQFYARTGQREAAAREIREYLPQATAEERPVLDRWLAELFAK